MIKYNASEALTEAYTIFLKQKDEAGDDRVFSMQENKASGAGFTKHKPSGSFLQINIKGKMIKRDLPPIVTKAPATKSGRTSTTYRVANCIEAGHILAAAESDPARRYMQIIWSWYTYRYNTDDMQDKIESSLTMWLTKQYIIALKNKPKRVAKYFKLARLTLQDARLRCTSQQTKYSQADMARVLEIDRSTFHNQWLKHYTAMGTIIHTKLDDPLMSKVGHSIAEMFSEAV